MRSVSGVSKLYRSRASTLSSRSYRFRRLSRRQAFCRREVLGTHKFGFVLAAPLFRAPRERGDVVLTWEIAPSGLLSKGGGTEEGGGGGTTDYRHVVTARNFTEGRRVGVPVPPDGTGVLVHPRWEEHRAGRRRPRGLAGARERVAGNVPRHGRPTGCADRSLCRVLADESEEVGMTIYIAYALKHWFRGLSSYLEVARQRERDGVKKSMFVCLEDLSDPKRERELYGAMLDFLFPGGHSYPYPRKVTTDGAKPYSGGHATNPEPRLHRRLVDLVRKLDRDVFKNHLSSVDTMIGCSGATH
jgi:hypothetical protein